MKAELEFVTFFYMTLTCAGAEKLPERSILSSKQVNFLTFKILEQSAILMILNAIAGFSMK